MPPPPDKEPVQGEDFLRGIGHWVWQRDEGFEDIKWHHEGMIGSTLGWLTHASPEHWLTKVSDARWELKEVDATSIMRRTRTVMLDIGKEGPEKQVKGLDGRDYKGRVKTHWDGEKLVVHTHANRKDSEVDWQSTREIVDGLVHETIEDKAHSLIGRRIFKLHPYYTIDNQTRKLLTLVVYSVLDVMGLYPLCKKNIIPGLQCVEASSPDVEEERAYFVMVARDNIAGTEEKTYFVKIPAFDCLTLTMENFA